MKIFIKIFAWIKKLSYLCTRKSNGAIAQLVEQRTENPCVPGSIPGGTTKKRPLKVSFLCIISSENGAGWTKVDKPEIGYRDIGEPGLLTGWSAIVISESVVDASMLFCLLPPE